VAREFNFKSASRDRKKEQEEATPESSRIDFKAKKVPKYKFFELKEREKAQFEFKEFNLKTLSRE